MKDLSPIRADSLASLSDTRQKIKPPNHTSVATDAMTPTHWVVIKKFSQKMELVAREEFTHRDVDRMTEILGGYLKRMASPQSKPFNYFEITIIASKE